MGRAPIELTIETFDLGEGELDSVFFADLAAGAIHWDLRPEAARARELEIHGLYEKPPKHGAKFSFAVNSVEQIDAVTVRAIRRVVDRLAPEDVEAVKDARRISGDPRWIAAYCDIDFQEVVAVLANLNEQERGYSGL